MEAKELDPLALEIAEYTDDPLGFVLDCFSWGDGLLTGETGPDDWQLKFLEDLSNLVKSRQFDGSNPVAPIQMAIASGHGIGKSTLMAWLHWWMRDSESG